MTKDNQIILVIEDEVNVRTVMAEIITYLGYDVVLANNGKTGLQHIIKRKFDLVITDLGLPDIDGEQLIEFMRAKGIETPVLMVGGVDDKTGAARCNKWQNCHYISKPFDINEINRQLAELLKTAAKSHNKNNSNVNNRPL